MYGRCPLIWEMSMYERCPLMDKVCLWEVFLIEHTSTYAWEVYPSGKVSTKFL